MTEKQTIQVVGDTCKRETLEEGHGPDFCGTCSDAIKDWVQWEGHTFREAQLIANIAPRVLDPYDPRLDT